MSKQKHLCRKITEESNNAESSNQLNVEASAKEFSADEQLAAFAEIIIDQFYNQFYAEKQNGL